MCRRGGKVINFLINTDTKFLNIMLFTDKMRIYLNDLWPNVVYSNDAKINIFVDVNNYIKNNRMKNIITIGTGND